MDKDAVSTGARSRSVVDDRLGAVYAQIDALSRDLRGTHDELEQLRHAEAQLKVVLTLHLSSPNPQEQTNIETCRRLLQLMRIACPQAGALCQ